MPRNSTFHPDLGTLSILPLEIRETIYANLLNFNAPYLPNPLSRRKRLIPPPPPPSHRGNRTALLRTSKRISCESKKVLVNVNEWVMVVEPDKKNEMGGNFSVSGRPGWFRSFGHPHIYNGSGQVAMFNPMEIMALFESGAVKELRLVDVRIGTMAGVKETDLVPWKRQRIFGPERPSFCPLVVVMKHVVLMLKECTQLHYLKVTIGSTERRPGSVELLLDDLRQLRGVRKAEIVAYSFEKGDRKWVDWMINRKYAFYLQRIMALPKGAPTPAYVPDEKPPPYAIKTEGVFDIIEADYMSQPASDDGREEGELQSGTEESADDISDEDNASFIGAGLPGLMPPWTGHDSDIEDELEGLMEDLD